VYPVLRGKDIETGEFLPEKRDEQFAIFKEAQKKVLDLKYWHQFFSALIGAGFRSYEQISSEITLLYSYAFYLIGKCQYRVPEHKLQKLIGRWYFSTALTSRYTGSYESTMDADLNRVKELPGAGTFVNTLEKIIGDTLTHDFWTITLPNSLETQSSNSPGLNAYEASQNLLGFKVLFSHKKIADMLDPTIEAKKKALDRHHLFPRGHLRTIGIDKPKEINQIANLAWLEWPENIDIGASPPSKYVPKLRKRFSDSEWKKMHRTHALPLSWEKMSYDEFLVERRKLMAQIIKKAFDSLI
jgi:hypothetical protein